jgi:glycosyltransferase involved in cell wall biosynthesis
MMKVAFVTTHDSTDKHAWSGIIFHMLAALRGAGLEVDAIDLFEDPLAILLKAKSRLKNVMFRKRCHYDREPMALRRYARMVESRLNNLKPDIIFSPGTIPIAYLKTKIPIIFWTDATFDGMVNFYSEFTNLCDKTLHDGHRMEQAALSGCRLAIYASEWAAKTAIDKYEVNDKKIKVVPFGANIEHAPPVNEIQKLFEVRSSGVFKLLFVGVDWKRKGGNKAFTVASMLNERGLPTELHVVGCEPPSSLPSFVKRHGYLSKKNPQENEHLMDLYKTSNFFILPSEAECMGIVIAEASACGLPSVTTNVGGFTSVVRDGINGRTFDSKSFDVDCTNYILEIMSSKERYHQLCLSSMKEYKERLNWESAVQSVIELMTADGIIQLK